MLQPPTKSQKSHTHTHTNTRTRARAAAKDPGNRNPGKVPGKLHSHIQTQESRRQLKARDIPRVTERATQGKKKDRGPRLTCAQAREIKSRVSSALMVFPHTGGGEEEQRPALPWRGVDISASVALILSHEGLRNNAAPGGCGHTSTMQGPGIEITCGTCFINHNTGAMSLIIAPKSQGYTQGLSREGPKPTKSHKGSLSLLLCTHTKPQRVPAAHMEAQAHSTMSQRDTDRNIHTKIESEADYRHSPRGFNHTHQVLDAQRHTQVTWVCTQS